MRNRISLGVLAALAGCGDNDRIACGDGTTLVEGVCQLGTGEGTCGSGTMLQGSACVPVGDPASGPTITAITPQDAGAAGGTPFAILGTGFAGENVTDLTVFFGDTTDVSCQAVVYTVTATTIAGEVPSFCDINVTVTVTTNLGLATTPFHYNAVFAADGDGGGNHGVGGDLWVIDPSSAVFDFGPIVDANGTDYPISGIAFDPTGTLWGVTTGDGVHGDTHGVSQLVTIDPRTPGKSTVTIIGDAVDAHGDGYRVTDIKVADGTLYGWAYDVTADTQSLVAIDMTSGVVTALGTPTAMSFKVPEGALTIVGPNNGYVAANGASTDATVDASGELDIADLTSGGLTEKTALDWAENHIPVGAPVNAMDGIFGLTIAVIDNGTYGRMTAEPDTWYGETLAIVHAMQTPVITPVFELPAKPTRQSAIDGIAVPTSLTATLQIANKAHTVERTPARGPGIR